MGENRVKGVVCPQFTLAYYDGVKRIKKKFADLAEAKREADLAADTRVTRFVPHERAIKPAGSFKTIFWVCVV